MNGVSVSSGSPSGPINLNVGSNVINVVVTAQAGNTKTYTVTVTRAASTNANLSNLVLSSGTLSPSFSPSVTSYTASVSNATTSITVTPTVEQPNATVKVNGTTVASGTPSGPISLNVGSNVISVMVTAQDGTTTKTYTVTVTRAPSSNANLSNLVLSSGTLSPSFSPSVTSYTASVSNSTTSITVTPTVQDSTATVKVNGVSVPSGTPSGPISLNVGSNVINVVVTAQDGTTMKTYTVTVTRAASTNANLSNLVLSSGTLNPSFSPSVTSYTAGVSNSTTSITVTPTVQDSTATVKVNGVSVPSGSPSGPISLNVGANVINVVVTAQDGTTTKTYTVTVTRAASTNANLSNLVLSSGTLSPSFDPSVISYTASVSNATTSITVTPTVQDATATVKVNGVSVPSGTPSGPISLNVGPNAISVVVTAQDGTTMKTYTVTVTRASSSNANLSNLVLSSGSLSPSFSPSVTSYTASVSNSTTSITVTPTVQDSTATVKVNGVSVPSGTPSAPISLNVGANTINVVVTAQDGTTMKTYTVTVTRAASSNANLSNLVPSSGTLSPSFSPSVTSYTTSVPNSTTSITVTPTAQDSTATITVNGNSVPSGTASGPISLSVGHNAVVTVVTAQDTTTTKNYTLDVFRAGNVNVTATAGQTSAAYVTLKDAVDAINAGTHQGTLTVSIDLDTTETSTAALNASGSGSASYASVTITPVGMRTISGNIAAPLIDLNGASNVTINGLNSGGNSLTISNASTSATAGASTIRFVNGAQSNLVTNCTILGSTTGTNPTATANVLFHTSTGTGNSNNTISFCNIGPAGANQPSKCVMGLGSPGAVNTSNIIDSNNIFDFFNPTASVTGIGVQGNTNNWTISNNRIYQTAPRTFASNNLRYSGILLTNSAGAYTISGNVIGFGAPNGTGTTAISGLTNTVRGIDATSVSTSTPTSIQGNMISGISQSTAITAAGTSTNFVGIMLGSTDGRFNVGNVTGNTIGSLDGSSGITVTSSAGSGAVTGIYDFSFQANTIANNSIGSITIGGSGTGNGFRGVLVNTGNSLLETINNNTVANITDNQVGNYVMYGVQVTLPAVSMSGNLVRNMNGNANGAAVVMSGIAMSSSAATSASTISQNTVHSLSNNVTGGSAGSVYAIDLTLPAQANVIGRNLVHSVDVNSSFTSYQIWGLVMRGTGSATFQNNIVRLGLKADGSSITTGYSIIGIRDFAGATSSYYHNSVYVGGTAVASASNTYCFFSDVVTNTRNYVNNVFHNGRSNASGGIANAVIAVGGSASNPPGLTSNFNVLYSNGTDSAIGVFNSVVQTTLINWQAATGQDANSRSADPRFSAPNGTATTGDLHIQSSTNTPVEAAGTLVASVTNDFDGQARSSLTPVDIGADAGNFIPASTNADLSNLVLSNGILNPVFDPATTSYTASVPNATTSITVTPTVVQANATVQVNGNGVPSGSASQPISLNVGPNTITVMVTAEAGNMKTYTVVVTRTASSNANLSNLVLSDGTLAPPFGPGIFAYSASVSNATTSITVTPTAQDSNATITVNGNPVVSGNASAPIGLSVGHNTVVTIVTAQDTTTTKTYTVDVFRFGNVNVTASAGETSAAYNTLKDAFHGVNAGAHQGTITISIDLDTTEVAPAALNGSASYTSITIMPNGARTISGNIAAPLIDLNGASNVTINGLNTGSNSLTFSNTSTSATAATSTIRFVNGAQNNLITNCFVLGSATGTNATATANVLFHTSPGAGNSNNTVSFCNIGPAGANQPSKCVMGLGSAGAVNTSNVIDSNNIFDFFNPTASVTGISVQGNTNNWTISNNRIYQTAPRTFASNNLRYSGILLTNSAGAYAISGNVIGFGAPNGTGTTTISGLTNTVRGIDATSVSTSTPTSIQGNVISGISQSTAITAAGTSTNFVGIMLGSTDGRFNVGNITGNSVGSLDGSSSITVASSAGSGAVTGIYDFSFQSNTIANNNVGSITIGGAGTSNGFRGILVNTGSSIVEAISNNTIAGITDNQVGNYAMHGIQVSLPAVSMNGNVVRNMSGNANGAALVMGGIAMSSSAATAASTISGNTIHSLTNAVTGGSAGSIYAIDLTLPAQANVIERNLVHSLDVSSVLTGYQIWGIVMRGSGSATVQNNMVRLGLKADGSSITTGYSIVGIRDIAGATASYYHNSVYVGGTGVASVSNTYCFFSDVVTNTRNFVDNVFYNGRSNASGGIANVAITVGGTAPSPAGLTSNNNVLYFNGTDGATGVFNSTVQTTLADWRAATGQDANSRFGDPQFIAANGNATTGDLHIQAGINSPIEAAGALVASVTNDFDGETRSNLTPVDVGADAGNFTPWSINADLSNLMLSDGALNPAFDPAITSYTAIVPEAITSITVTPTVAESHATVRVNGNIVPSGSPSDPIPLSLGMNAITVEVTAQVGNMKTYTLAVTRASSNANLSNLTLSAAALNEPFDPNTTSYTASVPNSTTSTTVTPTVQEPNATVTVNGMPVPSGMPSGSISLNVGTNVINIMVTAQDTATMKSYTITVTRAPSSNANLSNLTLSAGALNEPFDPNMTSYTADVPNSATSTTVTPTVQEPNATVTVNGMPVPSGMPSSSISLNVGTNAITIVVTAQDTTMKTYTITVTRPASSNANLSNLTLSDGALDPVFDPAIISYTASVKHKVTSITVTPTVEDPTATVQVNGVPVPSGMPSQSISLSVGNNTITVLVQAQDEQRINVPTTNKTYTVVVTRAPVPVVTNLNDSGAGSLRDALDDVLDGETINFNIMLHPSGVGAPMAVITLTSGELVVNNSVTIMGPGSNVMTIARDAGAAPFRIFSITPNHIVTIAGLTITGGNASPDVGGGIYNDHSNLTVVNCAINGNTAQFGAGGIYNDGFESGSATLLLSNSTLSGNTAGYGGGIVNDGFETGSATVSINNSTLSDNIAAGYGGAIYNFTGAIAAVTINNSTLSGNDAENGGAIYNDGTSSSGNASFSINNSTFSGNSATIGAAIFSDVDTGATVTGQISNSTFASNTAPNGGAIYDSVEGTGTSSWQIGNTILKKGAQGANIVNVGGSIVSAGYNLSDDDGSGFLTSAGDQINTDPMLGPLKDNGGTTMTHAPLIGSPAIDQGKRDAVPALATDLDQRGFVRPVDDSVVPNAIGGDASDIGAVELVGVHPTQISSRKTHGAVGDFNVDLPMANFATSPIGVECRTAGAGGAYKIVVSFASNVSFTSAVVYSGTGSVSSATGSGTSELTIDLAGVTDVQTLTLAVFDVDDGANISDFGVRMRVRIGDVTGNNAVNASDVTLTKSRLGNPVSSATFRADVNANGVINTSDVTLVKSKIQ